MTNQQFQIKMLKESKILTKILNNKGNILKSSFNESSGSLIQEHVFSREESSLKWINDAEKQALFICESIANFKYSKNEESNDSTE